MNFFSNTLGSQHLYNDNCIEPLADNLREAPNSKIITTEYEVRCREANDSIWMTRSHTVIQLRKLLSDYNKVK